MTGDAVRSSQGRNSGLRERKKAETRRALSAAALRLASELGPDRVTVEAIAEAAGVSPRTFFNYFSSKDDAIVDVGAESPSALLTDLQARPDDEAPVDALPRHGSRRGRPAGGDRRRPAAHASAWPSGTRRWRRGARRPWRRSSASWPRKIARRTGLHPDRDTFPALAALVALGAVRVGLATWYGRGRTAPLADHVAEAFDLVRRGAQTTPRVRRKGQ